MKPYSGSSNCTLCRLVDASFSSSSGGQPVHWLRWLDMVWPVWQYLVRQQGQRPCSHTGHTAATTHQSHQLDSLHMQKKKRKKMQARDTHLGVVVRAVALPLVRLVPLLAHAKLRFVGWACLDRVRARLQLQLGQPGGLHLMTVRPPRGQLRLLRRASGCRVDVATGRQLADQALLLKCGRGRRGSLALRARCGRRWWPRWCGASAGARYVRLKMPQRASHASGAPN